MLDVFTAWDPIIKSSQHEKLLNVANILEEKTSKDITFSAVDLEGNINKYVLGSIEGNSKFLLGYVNPGFRVLPYHYIIIDPNITEEEAQKLFDERGHPSNPRFWLEKGVEPFLEGDEQGITHPSFKNSETREISNTKEFTYNSSSYVADPELQIVYSLFEDKVYDWNLLRNTYFSSQNPEIFSLMEISRVANNISENDNTPIKEISKSYRMHEWDIDVVPLIKSIAKPGNIYRVNQYYGVCSEDSIKFYDENGISKSIEIRGNDYQEIALNPEEGAGSLVLLDFIDKYLQIDTTLLETYIE